MPRSPRVAMRRRAGFRETERRMRTLDSPIPPCPQCRARHVIVSERHPDEALCRVCGHRFMARQPRPMFWHLARMSKRRSPRAVSAPLPSSLAPQHGAGAARRGGE